MPDPAARVIPFPLVERRLHPCGLGLAQAEEAAFAEWLARELRLVDAWIDRLLGEGGDPRRIAVLDQHAAFLREAQRAS